MISVSVLPSSCGIRISMFSAILERICTISTYRSCSSAFRQEKAYRSVWAPRSSASAPSARPIAARADKKSPPASSPGFSTTVFSLPAYSFSCSLPAKASVCKSSPVLICLAVLFNCVSLPSNQVSVSSNTWAFCSSSWLIASFPSQPVRSKSGKSRVNSVKLRLTKPIPFQIPTTPDRDSGPGSCRHSTH